MQPLLFVFVFAYVFPKIGRGFSWGARQPGRLGGINFTTILVPGLIASRSSRGSRRSRCRSCRSSATAEIEDRVLAPVPVRVGLEKIVAGAVQSIIGAAIVFPIVFSFTPRAPRRTCT